MSEITFSGLSSGMDTAGMLEKLMEIERRPVQLLERKQTQILQKQGAFEQLDGIVKTFQGSVKTLNSRTTFHQFQASVSENKTLAHSISSQAAEGSYSIEVIQRAETEQFSSGIFASKTNTLNFSGNLVVNEQSITIATSDSLADIRNKINSANVQVTASIISVSSEDHRLILAANQTGENGINLSDSLDGSLLQQLGFTDSNGEQSSVSQRLSTDKTVQTTGSTNITSSTLFSEIDSGIVANKTISISGTNRDGQSVSGTYTYQNGDTVQAFLDQVQTVFGTSSISLSIEDGQIVVSDNTAGESLLSIDVDESNFGSTDTNLFGDFSVTTKGQDRVLQSGQDARLKINNINVTHETNKISNVIQGVTLDLLNTNAETGDPPITLRIEKDTSQIKSGMTEFVETYNGIVGFVKEQFAFDANTGVSGLLFGDSTVRSVQTQIQRLIGTTLNGLTGDNKNLLSLGISTDRAGIISLDDSALQSAIDSNLLSVEQLLRGEGTTTDEAIEYVGFNQHTQSGTYTIDITQAATKVILTAGSTFSSSGLTADDTLTITDFSSDAEAAVSLSTGDTLEEVIQKINTELSTSIAEVRTASQKIGTNGATATTNSKFTDLGYNTGDTINFSGTRHYGANVSQTSYTITDNSTVQDFLNTLESQFNGEITATLDSDGKIVITDNLAGNSNLSLSISGDLDIGSFGSTVLGRNRIAVTASSVDGKLHLEHNEYGSSYGFGVTASENDYTGIGTHQETSGQDVVGTINGQSADGSGQYLTGTDEAGDSEGLRLRVKLTPTDVDNNTARGTVTLTQGIAERLNRLLEGFVDDIDGQIKRRLDGFESQFDRTQDQVDKIERRLIQVEDRYKSQFLAMEKAMAEIQAQTAFLESQLAGLSGKKDDD